MGNKNNVFVLQFSSVFCLMLGILTIELLSVRSPKNTMKRWNGIYNIRSALIVLLIGGEHMCYRQKREASLIASKEAGLK